MAISRRGPGKVKTRSRRGQGKVQRQEQGKINIRLKQSNHNHNHNYNLMGFDTIEINLVCLYSFIEIHPDLQPEYCTPHRPHKDIGHKHNITIYSPKHETLRTNANKLAL